jgi:hypothetical protein
VVEAALLALIAIAAIVLAIAGLAAFTGTVKEQFDKKVQEEMEKQRAQHPESSGEQEKVQSLPAQNFIYGALAMYALPLLAALTLGGTALWALLSPTTGRWFRFAREIRLEHRRLKEQLAA